MKRRDTTRPPTLLSLTQLDPSAALTRRLAAARETYAKALGIRVSPDDGYDPDVMSKWNTSFDY